MISELHCGGKAPVDLYRFKPQHIDNSKFSLGLSVCVHTNTTAGLTGMFVNRTRGSQLLFNPVTSEQGRVLSPQAPAQVTPFCDTFNKFAVSSCRTSEQRLSTGDLLHIVVTAASVY